MRKNEEGFVSRNIRYTVSDAGGIATLYCTVSENPNLACAQATINKIYTNERCRRLRVGLGPEGKAIDADTHEPVSLPLVWQINVRCTFQDQTLWDVEELEIDANVCGIKVSNDIFPHVKRVISHSPYFRDSSCLVETGDDGDVLLNTFCKGKGELIDLGGIRDIESYAFRGCHSANIINASPDIRIGSSYAFDGYYPDDVKGTLCIGNHLIKADTECKEFHMPPKVSVIGDCAFADTKAETIYFESERSVRTLCDIKAPNLKAAIFDFRNGEAWLGLGNSTTFLSNKSIEEFVIPETDLNYMSVDGIIYTKDGKRLLRCPMGKTGHVDIPEGVEYIANCAFQASGVESVSFPESLRVINDCAFSASRIKDVVLPGNVEQIGKNNFMDATSVTAKGVRPIKGLLSACIGMTRYHVKYINGTDHIIRFNISGRRFFLPSSVDYDKSRQIFEDWDNGTIFEGIEQYAFQCAANPAMKQDAALEAITWGLDSGEARKYLKNCAEKAMDRYLEKNDIGQAIKLAKAGLLPAAKVKGLLDAPDTDKLLKAYLLEISKNKRKKSVSLAA